MGIVENFGVEIIYVIFLGFELPAEIKSIIQATPMSIAGGGRDRIAWIGNPRGIFDLKSAYSLTRETDTMCSINARWIWKSETLPKIKTFLWRCVHNSIGVKTCLAKRGIVGEERCPICQREPETILHALRDCTRAKQAWIQLGVKETSGDFWLSNLQEWLQINEKVNSSYIEGKPPWRLIFNFAVWSMWKSRNLYVFNRKNPNPNLVAEIYNQMLEFMFCVSSPRNPVRKINRIVRWEKPLVGWRKLNTDGSSLGCLERSGCGGVVRDEHGHWVAGFARHVGTTNSLAAELWGLRDGLLL